MTHRYRLELVSYKLCPYVQRSVITLRHKKAPYEIQYIDLENPPAWFEQVSPLGQVPVLKVTEGDRTTVIFESAVINEFIDETVGQRMLSENPLERAADRAWIAFGGELLMQNYMMFQATDREALEPLLAEFLTDLGRLEAVLATNSKEGPFFRGSAFGLVDAAYAPLFMSMFLWDALNPDSPKADRRLKDMPRVMAWAKSLLAQPQVRESVVPEYASLYRDFARESKSAILRFTDG